jgi:hypothetical protein
MDSLFLTDTLPDFLWEVILMFLTHFSGKPFLQDPHSIFMPPLTLITGIPTKLLSLVSWYCYSSV